jgi:hypothetical protein
MGPRDSHDEVTDDDLRDEIELLGDVITAAIGCPGHLSAAEVDLALGVDGLVCRASGSPAPPDEGPPPPGVGPEARPDVEAEVAH